MYNTAAKLSVYAYVKRLRDYATYMHIKFSEPKHYDPAAVIDLQKTCDMMLDDKETKPYQLQTNVSFALLDVEDLILQKTEELRALENLKYGIDSCYKNIVKELPKA